MKLITLLLVAALSNGCAFVNASPDGRLKAVALGQAKVEHCSEGGECVRVEGGMLSEGFTGLLKDLVRIPFAIIGGAAGAVAPPSQ